MGIMIRTRSRYRYILGIFVGCAAILFALLTLYSVSQTDITVQIQRRPTIIAKEFAVPETSILHDEENAYAQFIEDELTLSIDTIPVNEQQRSDALSGSVTLINTTAKDQPLIQGTRLLTESGAMFRTQKTVTVPARSRTTVTAKADDENLESIPASTRFTIIALWEGLHDKIYGERTEPLTRQSQFVRILAGSDIEQARVSLEQKLLDEGVKKMQSRLDSRYTIPSSLMIKEVINTTHTGTLGQDTPSFTSTATIRLTAVAIDEKQLRSKLLTDESNVVSSKESLNSIPLSLEFSSIDLKKKTAQLVAKIVVPPSIPADAEGIEKILTGKTPKEISELFQTQFFAKSTNVKITPIPLPIVISAPNHIRISYEFIP